MPEDFILSIIMLLFAAWIIYLYCKNYFVIPYLIGPEFAEKNESFKTYTITDSNGNTERIITAKSIKQLISRLEEVSYQTEEQCIT